MQYIDNPSKLSYDETFRIHNFFGWFGLPFLVLGVLGLVKLAGIDHQKLERLIRFHTRESLS